jgi:hypothetical protein
LVWSLAILFYTLFAPTPRSSFFPEIDIAAKVAAESNLGQGSPLIRLLAPLSHSVSSNIRKRLAGEKFVLHYARISSPLVSQTETEDIGLSSNRSSLYSRSEDAISTSGDDEFPGRRGESSRSTNIHDRLESLDKKIQLG